ncbi:hypothetical protein GQ53DRAFT_809886, partial [Thozetella sp. PMI_491]
MSPKTTRREYRGYACHRCHKQKVKVTIPESYLRSLERDLAGPSSIVTTTGASAGDAGDSSQQPGPQDSGIDGARRPIDSVVENSNADAFVLKLKEIRDRNSHSNSSPGPLHVQSEARRPQAQSDYLELGSSQQPKYEYFELTFDTLHEQCTFKLPPYPYAIYLLDQFSIFFGHDWHLFRVQKFRQQLHNIYMTAHSSESKDRTWLCQLLVVLALAESADASRQPEINQSSNDDTSESPRHDTARASTHPPGRELFEQALRLLSVPFENASVSHVEVLNMIALYSNQLNRQKTAYMY